MKKGDPNYKGACGGKETFGALPLEEATAENLYK